MLDHINASVQQIERPLMTPDEVMRILPPKKVREGSIERIVAPGEMLIFVSGHPPILGTQILYFMDAAFADHAAIRPPLHLKAIEEGAAVDQRPLDLARHRTSRPERADRGEERAEESTVVAHPTTGVFYEQPCPPPLTFHQENAIRRDPYYIPHVGPPEKGVDEPALDLNPKEL